MKGQLYKNPILFAVVSTLVILIGSIIMMVYPMMTREMHPKLEALKPYTALQLAGKDIYQREGCNNCHTQTVRPLRAEVARYGEYSKAGEFAYDRPFLWGSKRTGPDLARVGGKYPDMWHYRHFENPRAFFVESNMPAYGWLKDAKLDPKDMEAHMKVNGFPYTPEEMTTLLSKTELDALVAYMQVIGTAVTRKLAAAPAAAAENEGKNPLAGDTHAIHEGKELFDSNCSACHGGKGEGGIGPALTDKVQLSDGKIYTTIDKGTQGGMPPFGAGMDKKKIWSLVSYVRSLQTK
jgi:cytochrome c oxidase cbb3-type subunit 2